MSLNAVLWSPWPHRLGAVLLSLLGLAIVGVLGAAAYFTSQIRTHPVMTFEKARTDPTQVAEFDLHGRYTPAAWGFPFRAASFRSTPDGLALSTWVVPPTDTAATDCALVFVHGRHDNRLKALKYLPLLREAGITDRCLTVFPDLRGSGTSARGASDMGWNHAEDLTSTLEFVARTYGTRRFFVYSFSMGALSTVTMLQRPELLTRLRLSGIQLDRIVMDSPLASAEALVRYSGDTRHLPVWLVNGALFGFRRFVDLPKLRLGGFLRYAGIPVLLLHGLADTTTPYRFVEAERPFSGKVRVVELPGGDHVKLMNNPATAPQYRAGVLPFLRAWRRGVDVAPVYLNRPGPPTRR